MKKTASAKYMFWAIIALGVFARVFRFGAVPGGINQDEAFAAWEAFNILSTGCDSFGYRLPVYLTAWGSGMNALESYLMIPFIALFGLKTWVIRLPQLVVGIFTLPAVYSIMKKAGGEKAGLFAMLLLAVCPWHILLSRWALESNLAPGMLCFGLCFFMKGLEDRRFLSLSALFYGLSLYAYATLWPILPVMLLLQIIYAASLKKFRLDRYSLGAAAILAAFALPLLLFLAVNYGLIGEIKTGLISVPKLLYMRSGELSFKHIPENLKNLIKILVTQSDGLIWNTAESFGIIYKITLPFVPVGIVGAIVNTVRKTRARECAPEAYVLIWLLGGLITGALISVNINRVNLIFIPVVLLAAMGIKLVCSAIDKRALAIAAIVYIIIFAGFEHYYFTDYAGKIEQGFNGGMQYAVEAVKNEEKVYISSNISYSKILFYSQTTAEVYAGTVEYSNYPSAFLSVNSFERYDFIKSIDEADGTAPVILSIYDSTAPYISAGYTAEQYGTVTLLVPPAE